ncbi:MAG: MMPL family transporter [Actinobacteria bacterium]|nr:MMPL family transporter [Thermoleophilia bacterium]MCB9012387.1 MMPL family transporter [Actinomycetota bacterium]
MSTSRTTTHTRDALARVVTAVAGRAIRHRGLTITLWLIAVVACVVAGGIVGQRQLTETQTMVGESRAANARIVQAGLEDATSEIIFVQGSRAPVAQAVAELRTRLAQTTGVAGVAVDGRTPDGRDVLLRVDEAGDGDLPPLDATVADVRSGHPEVRIRQSGDLSVERDFAAMIDRELGRIELLSIPICLGILLIAFGSIVAAFIPLLFGVGGIAAAMGIVSLTSPLVPVGDPTAPTVTVLGLAFGVDYSLFMLRRYRQIRATGSGTDAALMATVATVGRAILVAGATVMLAVAGMLFTGSGIFTSMAVGIMIVVAVAVAGSATLLPALLSLLGHRVEWGRLRRRSGRAGTTGLWGRLAARASARPVASLVIVFGGLAALAAPASSLRTSDLDLASLPASLSSVRVLKDVESTFQGAPMPERVVVSADDRDLHRERPALLRVAQTAKSATRGRGATSVRISEDGHTAVLVVPAPQLPASRIRGATRDLRAVLAPLEAGIGPGVTIRTAGPTSTSADFAERLATVTPLVVIAVLALAFLVLLPTFRSPLLALAVVMLNLLSVAAAYGILVLVFQRTWAEGLLGFTGIDAIVTWVPLFAFVILFGLSMDYTIVVLERMRELRSAGASPARAASEGIASTAGTITSAASVMVVTFALFATMSLLDMKQMGVALASAILIDATLVRGIALPAVVALIGRRWRVPGRAVAAVSR